MSQPRLPRIHFTPSYFLQPTNPIIINVIGAGGTGSQVVTALARMNHALIQLGHAGLYVRLWDDDLVTQANMGRQLFASAEVGHNKAVCLIRRINAFFGTNWTALPERYDAKNPVFANVFITCVDTVSTRIELGKTLGKLTHSGQQYRLDSPYYWLDFGNSQQTGQVVLATVGKHKKPASEKFEVVESLPLVTDEYAHELSAATDDNTPSCSLAEALTRQDLFINSTLAQMGCGLLWKLFREGMTPHRGFFLNLSDFRSSPIPV